VIFREAVHGDLPAIVALLADDVLGKARDHAVVDSAYEQAFADIDADPRNLLVVAGDDGDVVVDAPSAGPANDTPGTVHPGLARARPLPA
jgi:hypothetical protein